MPVLRKRFSVVHLSFYVLQDHKNFPNLENCGKFLKYAKDIMPSSACRMFDLKA